MNKETMNALEELFSKIPEKDLKKAVSELPDEKLEQLSGGTFWGSVKKFFGYDESSDSRGDPVAPPVQRNLHLPSVPSAPVLPSQGGPVYTTDTEIRNAFLSGKLKSLRNLRNAYKSIHPSFKGSMQDVLTILQI